jgi:hypothetical protein
MCACDEELSTNPASIINRMLMTMQLTRKIVSRDSKIGRFMDLMIAPI